MKKIMTICSALLALSFTVFISVSQADDFGFGENIQRPVNPGIDPNEALNRSEDPNDPLFTQANPGVEGIDCIDCLKRTYRKPYFFNTDPRTKGPGKDTTESKPSPGAGPASTR